MIWLGVAVLLSLPLAVLALLVWMYFYICRRYMDKLVRVFRERPLFVIPHGKQPPESEDVGVVTDDGLTLRGCYIRHRAASRRGVILFGLEFGSRRWACVPYCARLLDAGFDVFAVEPRNQGESDSLPGYEPMHWATAYELSDTRAALKHLKTRPDADPEGVGYFGISRGANVGLVAAAEDPYVRCVVTDGAFGTYSTMVPYMRKWIAIYDERYFAHGILPAWYYGLVAKAGIRRVEREDGVSLLSVEKAVRRLDRPLLMIHGGGDTYIKTEMARSVFEQAAGPKEFWLVPGAKHNRSLDVAGDEYHEKVLAFFGSHIGKAV